MHARVLGLAASALILAYGTTVANAQDQVTPQPDQQQTQSRASRRDTGQNMDGPSNGPRG